MARIHDLEQLVRERRVALAFEREAELRAHRALERGAELLGKAAEHRVRVLDRALGARVFARRVAVQADERQQRLREAKQFQCAMRGCIRYA